MKTRVYNEKIEINTAHTEAFWKMRAESAAEKGPEVMMCRDKCPDARAANEVFDEGYVIPRLGITSDTRILDVGCGVGRMAKMILPQCGFYCGTDFSGDIVKFAEQECAKIQGLYTEQCKFYPLSFGETVKRNTDFYGGPFDIMIVSGVCPYINDDELVQIFHHIPDLMNAHSTIYLQHPVGIETRLTPMISIRKKWVLSIVRSIVP